MREGPAAAPTTPIRHPRGIVEHCLLALLAREDLFGLAIAHRLLAAGVTTARASAVYPRLHRLERAGLVEPYWRRSARGAPRTYYRLLPAGRARLAEYDRRWEALRLAVDGILLRPDDGRGREPFEAPAAAFWLEFDEADRRVLEKLNEFARRRGVTPERAALAAIRSAMAFYEPERPEAQDPCEEGGR